MADLQASLEYAKEGGVHPRPSMRDRRSSSRPRCMTACPPHVCLLPDTCHRAGVILEAIKKVAENDRRMQTLDLGGGADRARARFYVYPC